MLKDTTGGHMLKDTTSRRLCASVWPPVCMRLATSHFKVYTVFSGGGDPRLHYRLLTLCPAAY